MASDRPHLRRPRSTVQRLQRTHQPNPSASGPPNRRYQTHPTSDPKTHPIATTWTATINIKQPPVQQGDASKQPNSSICGRPIKVDLATMVIRVCHSRQGANPSRTIQRGVTHSSPMHRPASPDPGSGHPSKQQQIRRIRSRWAPLQYPQIPEEDGRFHVPVKHGSHSRQTRQ
ncbi:hypothetical protein ACLOJK_036754 [Asimina triloba]